MTPLNTSFSLNQVSRPSSKRVEPEFRVEIAQDGFHSGVIEGLPDFSLSLFAHNQPLTAEAVPHIIEAQPDVVQAQSARTEQSPCLLTPPTQEPPHEDGWFFHQ